MNGSGEMLKATFQAKGIEVDPSKQAKNFLALKAKIIHSDELIKKFQSKAQECTSALKELKESKRKEATLEACITGLRAELQALHHENCSLKLSLRRKEEEWNRVTSKCAEQEVLIQQLTTRVGQLQFQSEAVEEQRRMVDALKDEKEKLKSLIARKKREYERFNQLAAMSPELKLKPSCSTISERRNSVLSIPFVPADIVTDAVDTTVGMDSDDTEIFIPELTSTVATHGRRDSTLSIRCVPASTVDATVYMDSDDTKKCLPDLHSTLTIPERRNPTLSIPCVPASTVYMDRDDTKKCLPVLHSTLTITEHRNPMLSIPCVPASTVDATVNMDRDDTKKCLPYLHSTLKIPERRNPTLSIPCVPASTVDAAVNMDSDDTKKCLPYLHSTLTVPERRNPTLSIPCVPASTVDTTVNMDSDDTKKCLPYLHSTPCVHVSTVDTTVNMDSDDTKKCLPYLHSTLAIPERRNSTLSIPCLPASTVDTSDSEDSDGTEICLPDLASTLSPLPFSPYHRLETVSPLPPTPPRSPILSTLSPLPMSPVASFATMTPLTPLPPSPQCVTMSPQLSVVDSQKLSCCKRLDLGVTTATSVASLPFEDLVPTCPPQPAPVQCVLNSHTSKQEARDSGDQDLRDTGSREVTEQVIVLETGSKQNKERQRIPEKEARDSGDHTGSREVTVTEQVIVLETGSNQNKERQCIPEKEARDSGDHTGSREVTVTEQVIVLETGSKQNKERQHIPEKLSVVDSQKLSCYGRLDLGVTTATSVASLPFEDLVPTCPPQPTPVQCVLNSPTSKQEARDSGYQDLGDTGSREVTEQVIVLETGSKQNKKIHHIPEKQCATLSPQLPVVDTQKLSCYKRLDLGVTTVASVASLPFEDLVPSCPPQSTPVQCVLNSPTSKQDEARDSGYQDLGDTGSREVTEQVIALETGSKQNKERQRIPEKSPVVDSQKLSCCKHLDLGVTTVASVASLPFEDFVPTCPPQSTPVQCVMNSCTSKLEARDSGDQDFGDTSLSGVTEQVIVLETENKPNKKRRRIPEKPSNLGVGDQSPLTKVHKCAVGDDVLPPAVRAGTLGGDSSDSPTQQKSASALVQQLPLPQQQLVDCMQCPLPLPPWLVTSMVTVQLADPPAPSRCLSTRKAVHKNVIFHRQAKQKLLDYVKHNLERMVCGFITLSTAIKAFSNLNNVNCPIGMAKAVTQFILNSYFPKIDEVVSLFKNLLKEVSKDHCRAVDPLSCSFAPPLLRAECQMIALFIHLCQMNAKMSPLLTELSKAFYQAALSPDIRFHQLLAFCRMLTAICRFQGDSERLQFLCSDLLRKPLKPSEFHVFIAISSVWPVVLARLPGVPLIEEKRIFPQGVEQQSISITLELILTELLKSQPGSVQMLKHFKVLCNWKQSLFHNPIDELTKVHIDLLRTSSRVCIDQYIGQFPWRRPQPSVMAFHLVHCLRMLSWHRGWAWTNDVLIRGHLWPTLQQWNNKSDSVREATVVCIIRLIGFISVLGLAVDHQSVSLVQLQKVLISLIEKAGKAKEVTLPIQLAAVDSLLDLCPSGHMKAKEVKALLFRWMDGLRGHAIWGFALVEEYKQRLCHYHECVL